MTQAYSLLLEMKKQGMASRDRGPSSSAVSFFFGSFFGLFLPRICFRRAVPTLVRRVFSRSFSRCTISSGRLPSLSRQMRIAGR